MATIIKQSTTITVQMGPALDKDDGVTEETAVSPTVNLSKNGAAHAARNSATAIAHDADGWYRVELNATDTNTVGRLQAYFQDPATHLPVWHEFQVVEEVIYDALFAASAAAFDANQRVDVGNWLGTAVTTSATTNKPQVDVDSIDDDAAAANNLEADYDGTGYNKSASTIGTTTTNTDMRGTDSAALASVATEARLAELDAANIPADLDAVLVDTNSLNDTKIPDTISLANINAEADTALTDYDPPTRAELTADKDEILAVLDEAQIMVRTTIATLASQTSFTLTAGSADDSAYVGAMAVITDVSTAAQKAVGLISAYTGASKTVTLVADPGVFVMAATDKISILAIPKSLPAALPDGAGGLPVSDAGGLDLDQIGTDAAAILVDTGTTLDGKIDTIDTNVDAILVDTGTTLDGRIPAALSAAGNMKSDALEINADATAAANLAKSALGIVPGACEGTPSTTVIQTDLAEATDDHYIGRVVVFTSGAAAYQASDITDYTGATGTITVTALTTAPAAADTFVII